MISNKQTTIKTADFEAEYRKLMKEIEELERTPKTSILRLLEGFRARVITYEPREEFAIPHFMEVR